MHRFIKLVLKIFAEIFYIIVAIILTLVTPLIFLSLLPIYTVRWLVSSWVKHFRPEFGKILTTRSTVFAIDDMNVKPLCSLCVVLIVEGDLSPVEFKDIIVRRLLNAKINNKSDELLHPELKQYVTSLLGFYFWKPEAKFDLDDHIVLPNVDIPFNANKMLTYNTALTEKPFVKGQSPWEFHLVRNYKPREFEDDYSVTGIIFRVHHSLCDGYSVLNLMSSSSDSVFNVARPIKVQKQLPNWKILLRKISFVFRIPYELVKCSIESFDVNEWHIPSGRLTRSLQSGYHPLIPITTLKEIKNRHGVSLTSVILAVFTGSLRNYMLLNHVKVPETMHSLTPLALPGHPDKLRNFMTVCFFELPLGISDPIERLHKIEKNLTKLKSSTFPWSVSILMQVCGGLFSWMVKLFAHQTIPTLVMTNFPGPDRRVEFFSRPLHELNFGGGLMIGNISVGMSSISYNGKISFVIGLDKSICPKESNSGGKPTMVELITKEVEVLGSFNNNSI